MFAMRRRDALSLASLLALSAVAATGARAQAFPSRPMRMVIPFTPGGSNDIVGRLLAESMAARLGQPVVVENRGGAGGLLGNDIVAKAPADGYTFLLGGSGSFVISSLVQPRVPYDITKDFAPIGFIGASPNIITVHPSVQATNLAELRDVARRASPPLSYATPGVGTTGHALGAMIGLVLGVELDHVPYRGTGPALNDVVAGRVNIITNAAAPLQPHIAAGTLRALAVAGKRRSAAMPDLPSSAEQGFPELDSATWYGLLAPAGTPQPVVTALHAALNATLAEPEVVRRLTESGVEVGTSESPEAFGRFLTTDRERWAQVVSRAKMRAE
jgi:tripartite-type tricarboxylate transporter receptor subunit TctC